LLKRTKDIIVDILGGEGRLSYSKYPKVIINTPSLHNHDISVLNDLANHGWEVDINSTDSGNIEIEIYLVEDELKWIESIRENSKI